MAATVLVPVPGLIVREFRTLVETAELLLDQAIEPVRNRLKNSLAEMNQADIDGHTKPEILDKWALEFDPKTRRAPYPTGHTLYWEREAGIEES